MLDWNTLSLKLDSLVVFHGLEQQPVFSAYQGFLRALDGSESQRVRAYCALTEVVYRKGFDLSLVLLEELCQDENLYLSALAAHGEPAPLLTDRALQELFILQELVELRCQDLQEAVRTALPLPRFSVSSVDLSAVYHERAAAVSTQGWGIFAKHTMFYVQDGTITPASPADDTSFSSLSCYEEQRQQLLDNTKALLAGLPAANTLLYGDAGTGKSSSVKAVVNSLASQGLRLIELQKHQLRELPRLMAQLEAFPLKFILFLDDLSFQQRDDDFNALKAALEGSSCAKAKNVAIYATSNRRHLVREAFSDREGDDIHLQDTLQETLSLSARFGATILFSVPGKELYLQIVHDLAQDAALVIDQAVLDAEAERFARERYGRSPRAARQLVDALLASAGIQDSEACST